MADVKRELPVKVGTVEPKGYVGNLVDAIMGRTSSLDLNRAVFIQRQMTNVIKTAVSSSSLAKDETVKKDLEVIASKIVAGSVKVTSNAFGHGVTYIAEANAKAKELAEAASKANAEQAKLEKDIEAQIAELQKQKETSAQETASYVSAVETIKSDVNDAIQFFG